MKRVYAVIKKVIIVVLLLAISQVIGKYLFKYIILRTAGVGRALYEFEINDILLQYKPFMTLLIQTLSMLMFIAYLKLTKNNLKEYTKLPKSKNIDLFIIAALGLSWSALFNIINIVKTKAISFPMIQSTINGIHPVVNFILEVAVICAIVAVTEEFIIRGILFKELRESGIGIKLAILVQALLFGFLHKTVYDSILFGIVSALIYLWQGSLLGCVLLHFSYNLVCIIFLYFFDFSYIREMRFFLMSASVLAIGLCLCYMFRRGILKHLLKCGGKNAEVKHIEKNF